MTIASRISETDRLRAVPLFRHASDGTLERLLSIARRERIAAGTVLFRQGEQGEEMVLLLAGSLRVTLTTDPHELCLAIAQPGEVLGEMALIDGEPRSATVTAEEPCELLVLDRPAFLSLLREEPDIALFVLRGMAARLRESIEHVFDIAHLDIYQRLLRQMRRLAIEHGEPCAEGIVIRHRLSADTLSKMIAVERDVVERLVAVLVTEGALLVRDEHFIIPDLERLTAQATPLMY